MVRGHLFVPWNQKNGNNCLLSHLFSIILEVLASAVSQEKENLKIQMGEDYL